uniref:sodium-dependent transporter n=1 Tax=Thermococcus sp. TaxID=35749 RepID=UPI0025CD3425
MNEINKWSIYLMFLVAGFATGIGSIGLFPQFWLQYGITGLAVHIVFLALFTYVAILEAERVMKSGYYFAELYNKVLQKPALLMAVVVTIVLFLSYYTANVMLSIVAPLVGTGALGRLVAKILMLALVYLVITRAKEKTFLVMAAGSVFFLVVIFLTAIVFRMQIPQGATFLGMGKHMMFEHVGISLSMIKDAASRAIY